MQQRFNAKKTVLAVSIGVALGVGLAACGGGDGGDNSPPVTAFTGNAWMNPSLIAAQAAATTDSAKEAVANRRANLLLAAMTLSQKMQQLTGALPEIVPEMPQCKGGRHVSSIAALNIPTFRITNGPVGLGQNDCVSASVPAVLYPIGGDMVDVSVYSSPTSAKATALPSAMGVAASFDPSVAASFGSVIGTEMLNLALHEFEAPGVNMARLPILGRNFEYFGEDPFLTGSMSVGEINAIQAKGLIGMAKHFVANEQETNRTTIQETIDRQVLRELYLLPFEMSVKDGKVASIMCAYNYVNGVSSCSNKETMTDILRTDWGFTGYVQSDFYATKTTVEPLTSGMDLMMPIPQQWKPALLNAALVAGTITKAQIDKALERRFTQMFKYGIFERQPLKQTAIDFTAGGKVAREIGGKSAVLLQNNGALPIGSAVQNVVVLGKSTQVYAQQAVAGGSMVGKSMGAGGGSSDVVPNYTVAPVAGIKAALVALGNSSATVRLILVDDANSTASIDGVATTFAAAQAAAAGADAVIVMAGTISEEGADRATFTSATGRALATSAADGSSLDWYAAAPNTIATTISSGNLAKNSNTVAMIQSIMGLSSATAKTMAQKTALVLKDNAGVAMPAALLGSAGPAILETWFPGQEDGNIVADLLFGLKNPSGKLPVTFPVVGKGFLDNVSASQFPGLVGSDGVTQTAEYTEKLNIGYRWYDANVSGQCAVVGGVNPCVAFPFGHGLSYTTFDIGSQRVLANGAKYDVTATVTNTGTKTGSEVVQVYLALPAGASSVGATQPPKRLVGFQKVELAAGASQTVTISIDSTASNHPLSVWSKSANAWVIPTGIYTVYVGNSSSPKSLVLVDRFDK